MELEVLGRPEKTLSNGILSRWNGSRTPLNYKFTSDLFPVNTVDVIGDILSIAYRPDKLGTRVTIPNGNTLNITKGDFISIKGTNTKLDDNIYKIKDLLSANSFILDTSFSETYSGTGGTGQRYYKGYKALVKVYVGAPSYHPYTTDQSKPTYLAGNMEVEFNADNTGVGNVRNYIKPDLNTEFDNTEVNSHNLWTSFYIEFAEYFDGKESITYQKDLLDDCVAFTDFTDPSFDNGLNDWLMSGSGEMWISGISSVAVSIPSSNSISKYLHQNKGLNSTSSYKISVQITLEDNTNEYGVLMVDGNGSIINSKNISSSGLVILEGVPLKESLSVGIEIRGSTVLSNKTVTIESMNIEANDGITSPCEYNAFAVLGTKQFQDELGGNFGDYLLNTVDQDITPKMLTHFEEVSLFPTKSETFDIFGQDTFVLSEFVGYINALIPANVFSSSLDGNNVFLEINTFNTQGGSIASDRIHVENKSDGVYSVPLESLALLYGKGWGYGYCQFITIPDNTLTDGDYGTYEN